MRIISGTAGRRTIIVPSSVARPSTDRLREALFSILGERLPDASVLDLFAGSGALGLEALSRGAKSCHLVDESREAAVVIKKNIKALELHGGRLVNQDVFRFLDTHSAGLYDLVFADPPYLKKGNDRDFVSEILNHENLPALMAEEGIMVIECPTSYQGEEVNGWKLLDSRSYGGCGILFYQR